MLSLTERFIFIVRNNHNYDKVSRSLLAMQNSSKEADYFVCFEFAQHPAATRKRYTKAVFNFYNTFFPGVTVHRKGHVFVDDLDLIYKGVLLNNYDRTRKYWNSMKEFITAELQRLPEDAKCGMIDYYGKS